MARNRIRLGMAPLAFIRAPFPTLYLIPPAGSQDPEISPTARHSATVLTSRHAAVHLNAEARDHRMPTGQQTIDDQDVDRIHARLRGRNIVLIGMMGAGKTSVGRRLAAALDLPFTDADAEIEQAANLTIAEIFSAYGEDHFREGERKVISRLLADGPKVIATGGGAFMNEETRAEIGRSAISVWLKATLPLLMERVQRKVNRPLLSQADPKTVIKRLLAVRNPVYATADITVASRDCPHAVIVGEVLKAIADFLSREKAK